MTPKKILFLIFLIGSTAQGITYVTPDFTDVTQAMIDDCEENSFSTLRHSVAGTDRVVLKYNGSDPAWVATLSLTKFTHAQILTEMATIDWKSTGGP